MLETCTLPKLHTLPRSLRTRSTIIRFSERSLAFVRRSSYSASSSSTFLPRRRVPLIGLDVITPYGSTARKRSGEELNTANPGKLRKAEYGAAFLERNAR